MLGNDGALTAARPKRTVTASSKLVDPQNTAEPIRSHKHAIELKRAAESANKQLGAASGPSDSRPSGNQASSTPPPTVLPSPEPQINANKFDFTITTGKVGGDGEDGEESGDELVERRK